MNFLRVYRTPLIILFVGGFLSVLAFKWDLPIRQVLVEAQGPKWQKTPEAKIYGQIRVWGDWPPIMVAAAISFLIFKARGNRRWSRIILAAMIASTLAGMIANASRLTTGRPRPREIPKIEHGFYGPYHNGRILVGVPAYNSFPSGHTATAFGLAAAVVFASPGWGLLVLIGAVGVAWSSIAIGAHHPSDVAVSITLAFLTGWFVVRFMKLRIRSGSSPKPEPPQA
jgi:membrane-associated phospholipid phosphatase